jgi:ubiquinone/menaquinone biosynthesis C-methylase UbiE
MESNDFRKFWDHQISPAHAHVEDAWFDRYAEEVMFFLHGKRIIADAGCGSGEILERIAASFDKIYAIDYSSTMLEKAKERIAKRNIAHVEFACDTIVNVATHCKSKVDAIYSNGVIQYLSETEFRNFLKASSGILNNDGNLILLNIPNRNARTLFMLGFYKHEKYVPFYKIVKGLVGLWLKIFISRLRNGFKSYDDGIGNWYTIDQLKKYGTEYGYSVSIYGSAAVEYYYRFHAILKKNG